MTSARRYVMNDLLYGHLRRALTEAVRDGRTDLVKELTRILAEEDRRDSEQIVAPANKVHHGEHWTESK